MSERNDEAQAIGIVMALAGAMFIMLFFFIYAVVCFVAIVLTVLMLFALNGSFTIGKWTVTPEEARLFLCCGVAGAVGLSLFLIFCAFLLQARIPADWWPYILLGGYSFGAVGLASMIADAEQKEAAASFISNPPALPPPTYQTYQSLPAPPPQPFRFASWDDEDAR